MVEREVALAALASLPDRDVEALTLITWHGLSIAEAASVTGCSARAFTVRLHRARRRLSEALRSADQITEPSAARPMQVGPRPAAAFRPSTTSVQGK